MKNVRMTESHLTKENLEFTNYDVNEIFSQLINVYYAEKTAKDEINNRKIIIVFDNLDRVDDQTVLKVVAIIQTILEGCKGNIVICRNIYFLIPIDEERIKSVFNSLANKSGTQNFTSHGADFVQKLFSYSIRIPDIKQSEWICFFNNKFHEVFGDSVGLTDLSKILTIFQVGVEKSSKRITPREIIHYLNDLALNKMYWGDAIGLPYQALYVALVNYEADKLDGLDSAEYISFNPNSFPSPVLVHYAIRTLNFEIKRVQEDLLRQKYKVQDVGQVYEIIHKNRLIRFLQDGESDKAGEILSKIPKDRVFPFYSNCLTALDMGMRNNLNILGNCYYVLSELDGLKESFKNSNMLISF